MELPVEVQVEHGDKQKYFIKIDDTVHEAIIDAKEQTIDT